MSQSQTDKLFTTSVPSVATSMSFRDPISPRKKEAEEITSVSELSKLNLTFHCNQLNILQSWGYSSVVECLFSMFKALG